MANERFRQTAGFLLKFSFCSAVLIFCALALGNAVARVTGEAPVAVNAAPTVTVVIDPGHGGRDGGASASDGTLEKGLNLAVAQKLAALLKTADVEVVMTRNDDIELAEPTSLHKKLDDLSARVAIASHAENAIFVSIHMNKYPVEKYRGLQVYYSDNREESRTLAEAIRLSALAGIDAENDRKCKSAGDAIYVLRELEIPAVLVECGFLSNAEETELLKTEDYQKRLAVTIYTAILTYLDDAEGGPE